MDKYVSDFFTFLTTVDSVGSLTLNCRIAGPGTILAAVVLTDNREFSIGEQAITACLLLAVLGITLLGLL